MWTDGRYLPIMRSSMHYVQGTHNKETNKKVMLLRIRYGGVNKQRKCRALF
jgi:hypothetical protein